MLAAPAAQPSDDRYAAWRQQRRQVAAAVGQALGTFRVHQRMLVLDCAVRLADELADVLRPMLDQPGHPTATALQDAVTQSLRLGRSAAPFYYLALSAPATRSRFAGRIGLLRDRTLVTELIGQSDRADQPDVAKGLAAIRQMAFMNQPGWWEQLPDELSGPTLRWISAIGADPAHKTDWLVQLAAEGSGAQRTATVDHLCQSSAEEATEALKRLVKHATHPPADGDPESGLAGRIVHELVRRLPSCPDVQQLMIDRLTHPDERVRELARQHVSRNCFEKYWAQYPRLPEEVRQFAAEKLRRVVPDLGERLGLKLASPESADRLQALRIIAQCGITETLTVPIHARCGDVDSRVRSAAVKLLADLPSAQSEQLAQSALADPDRRVRANAVEALEAQRTQSAAVALVRMLDDPDNRIRANAIKAVLSMDLATAGPCLGQMLADASPEHRLSALWVVERVGWFRPAEQVLRLAQQDTDRRVRRQALRVLSELRRLYRAGASRAIPQTKVRQNSEMKNEK